MLVRLWVLGDVRADGGMDGRCFYFIGGCCGLCLLLDVCAHEVAQELRGGAVAGFGSGCELGF